MAAEIVPAPLRQSSWLGLFWPAYNRGSLWLLNIPEAMHNLRPDERRACHQPEYTWTWRGDRLHAAVCDGSRNAPAAIDLVFRADECGLAIDLTVTNLLPAPYTPAASFGTCLRHSAAWRFGDPDGGRTMVRREGCWVSLRELFGGEAIRRARSMPLGQPDSVCDEGIIARLNDDRSAGVAIAWNRVHELCSNLAANISCIHSDPALGPVEPGKSARLCGRIWFGRWTLDELDDLHRKEFAS